MRNWAAERVRTVSDLLGRCSRRALIGASRAGGGAFRTWTHVHTWLTSFARALARNRIMRVREPDLLVSGNRIFQFVFSSHYYDCGSIDNIHLQLARARLYIHAVSVAAAMASDLPIDIDYAKFLPWLQSRGHIPAKWHALLKIARAKYALALAATSEEDVERYSISSVPSYVGALRAVRALEGREGRDLLGRCRGVARGWEVVVGAYEGKGVCLADMAGAMVRAVSVDGAALKEERLRLERSVADGARREGPAVRAAEEARARFVEMCAEFVGEGGGKGGFEAALERAVKVRAADVLRRAVEAGRVPGIGNALAYYDAFAAYVGAGGETCRVLRDVMAADKDEIVRPVAKDEVAAVTRGTGEDDGGGIDWGAMYAAGNVPETIAQEDAATEIDWGIEVDATGAEAGEIEVEPTSAASGTGIDWGDTVAEAEVVPAKDSPTLSDAGFRAEYLNDLIELHAFLSTRHAELTLGGDSAASLVLQQTNSGGASSRTAGEVLEMVHAVRAAQDALSGPAARRVLGLVVTREARRLREAECAAERLERAVVALRERRKAASEVLRAVEAAWEALRLEVVEVRREAERAMEKIYKGREVCILGDIRSVFPDERAQA